MWGKNQGKGKKEENWGEKRVKWWGMGRMRKRKREIRGKKGENEGKEGKKEKKENREKKDIEGKKGEKFRVGINRKNREKNIWLRDKY